MKVPGLLSLALPLLASAEALYDPALGTLPTAQGWNYVSLPLSAPISLVGQEARMDTTGILQVSAGISRIAPIPLDRTAGFTLRFTLRVLEENHGTRVDRSGCSVTVLGSDRKGIELGFWKDRVWAQSDSPLFTHAEEALWPNTESHTFELTLQGTTYTLGVGGKTVLTGAIRDYTPFVGLIDPYETPNFLFIGDNTTSAGASIGIGRVELTALPVTPPALSTLLIGDYLLLRWPEAVTGGVLEFSSGLGPEAVWTAVGASPLKQGAFWEVAVAVTESARFFRLRP